jgi:hypothetical protein
MREKAIQQVSAAEKALTHLLSTQEPLSRSDPRVIGALLMAKEGLDAAMLYLSGELLGEQDARAYGEYS